MAETEAIDQPLSETTSTKTTQTTQKHQADNQWIAARGIVSRYQMVQQKLFRYYMTYPHFRLTPPPGRCLDGCP